MQDQPLNIAMESLLWQEDLKHQARLLGVESGSARIGPRSDHAGGVRVTRLLPTSHHAVPRRPGRPGDLRVAREFPDRGGHLRIVVAGTTGEPALLTAEERKTLAETAINAAAGKVPVVVASGAPSLADTIELTTHADGIGAAAAVLVVTPAFTRPPQRGLIDFYEQVCRCTDKPVLMYHIPGRSATTATADTVEAIAERCDNFVGAKHASTDLGWVTDVWCDWGPNSGCSLGSRNTRCRCWPSVPQAWSTLCPTCFPPRLRRSTRPCRTRSSRGPAPAPSAVGLNKSVFFDTNPIPIKYMMQPAGLVPGNRSDFPWLRRPPKWNGAATRSSPQRPDYDNDIAR